MPAGLPGPPTADPEGAAAQGVGAGAGAAAGSAAGNGSLWMKMDHLGPIIVNRDGTMSRIEKWAELTEGERTNALRIIAARNKRRMAALEAWGV